MKIVVLSGAGISAESGIKTFRDADGLWEGHDVMEVASPQGWQKNQELVLDFYNQRRAQLHTVEPNLGHTSINDLQEDHQVVVITQNVDDLHERAGNHNIIHLHGELRKVRSLGDPALIYDWPGDLNLGDTCEKGHQLRPHIVWFGEEVPMLGVAAREIYDANIAIIVGTSMQVYPAAGLISYLPADGKIFYVDPKPQINFELSVLGDRLQVISEKASVGMPLVVSRILEGNI